MRYNKLKNNSDKKTKDTGHPTGYSVSFGYMSNLVPRDLNYTPCEQQKLYAFGTACFVALCATLAGATFGGSLVRAQTRSLCERRCKRGQISPSPPKNERHGTPFWVFRVFWRRRRDLNSRAGNSRPTPLAGAPLRPLEYFSVWQTVVS